MMRCPVCEKNSLAAHSLALALRGYRCGACRGIWIETRDYWQWRQQQPEDLPERSGEAISVSTTDSAKAKICPSCRHLLLPYRIGHDVPFALDYCGHCAGVWLDAMEWELLVTRNLHDNLHQMFDRTWQQKVRSAEHQLAMERIYQARFGCEGYEELQRIHHWIYEHPQRDLLLAYLVNPEPCKPPKT